MAAERKNKPLPDTEVDVEVLAKKVEELKRVGILVQQERSANYSVEVVLQPKGIVNVNIKFPPIKNEEEFVDSLSMLIYALNNGRLRGMMAEKMIESAKAYNIEPQMAQVVGKWRALEAGDIEGPCIKPREVFG